MNSSKIVLEDVTKSFKTPKGEELTAVSDVNLEVEEGKFVSLLGPSGCGKSTLLNLVAGFISPTIGSVKVSGEPVSGPGSNRAVVFQETESLFEWKTVLENVKFGPLSVGINEEEAEKRGRKYLEMVGLTKEFADHYPDQLSGGMQQRLNLARALAIDPTIMLMDEPFGALDAQTKTILQNALIHIWERTDQTILFVTHDVEEAVYLSERVILMTAGGPGEIKSRYKVDFSYPREFELREAEEFIEIKNEILEDLYEESVAASQQMLEGI